MEKTLQTTDSINLNLTDEDEEEIDAMFEKQKTALVLLDAKPLLHEFIRSLNCVLDGLSTTDFNNIVKEQRSLLLVHNLRLISTKLQPYNMKTPAQNNVTFSPRTPIVLQLWRTALPIVVRSMRYKSKQLVAAKISLQLLKEFHVPAIQSEEVGLLHTQDVKYLRRLCVDGVSTSVDLSQENKRLLRLRIPQLRQKLQAETKKQNETRANEYASSKDIARLAHDLQLTTEATIEMGKLMALEETWVGAHNAKEFVRGYLDDVIGRIRLKETPVVRHIMMQGNTGTGKKLAADFIARWMAIVNSKAKSSMSKFTIGKPAWMKVGKLAELKVAAPGPLKVGDRAKITALDSSSATVKGVQYAFTSLCEPAMTTTAVEVMSFKELAKELEDLPKGQPQTFYMRLGGAKGGVDAILHEASVKKCVIIFGGEARTCQSFAACKYFLRFIPQVIEMPCLTVEELSQISLQFIDERGYKLSAGITGGALRAMVNIVAQKYSKSEMVKRNAYLAADCVELAVSRKNRRLRDYENEDKEHRSAAAAPLPFLLEAVDFDVKTISLEERTRKQALVDAKIRSMVGWGEEDTVSSPLHWFATVKRIIQNQNKQQSNNNNTSTDKQGNKTLSTQLSNVAEADMQPWDFNLIVEGPAGIGKTSFVQIATEFLAAYGILESSSLLKRSAGELRAGKWDSDDDAKLKATGAFAEAKEQGGGLLVADAESLCPSSIIGASSGAGTGGGAGGSVTATVLAAQTATLDFVALACVEGTARAVLSAHPDLGSKFPWIVKIEVPTDAEMAIIAREYSENVRGVLFEDGLEEKLVEHIHENNDGTTGLRYAHTQVDNALRRRAERRSAFSSKKLKNKNKNKRNTQGETKSEVDANINSNKGDLCDNPLLIPADFEIGKELGDSEAREEIYREMEALIGMEEAKSWLRKIRRQIDLANRTKDRSGLKKCFNLVLTGKPGTGKTTFARMVHRFLKAHGVLTGEFVEKNALELKGEYVGSTTPMVKACFQEAKGGTLFLDEAYALANESFKSGGDTFSKEAIRTLLTEVENNRTGTVVILAGYADKMKNLMRADPGLPRRFPHALQLANYTPSELASIAQHVAKARFSRTFEDGLEEKLAKHIKHKYRKDIDEQNGGLSVNLVESAVTNQEDRIMCEFEQSQELLLASSSSAVISEEETRQATQAIVDSKKVLLAIDFGIKDTPELGTTEKEQKEVEAELASLIGMDNVKKFFHKMKNQALFVQKTGKVEALGGCLHLVLTGNPGTGKTTTARLIARYLRAFGILPTDQFHEVNGLHLKGRYVGQTAHHVSNIVKDAIGGCLFIDEAYSLAADGGDAFGKEVIRTLLTEVENHRSDLLVILAGYKGPMENLMSADPGLRSRFNTRLHLKDYSSNEVAKIAELTAKRKTFVFENDLVANLGLRIEKTYGKRRISQENGRMAVNLVERAIERMATRLISSGISDDEIRKYDSILKLEDFEDEGWPADIEMDDEDDEENENVIEIIPHTRNMSNNNTTPLMQHLQPHPPPEEEELRFREPRIRQGGGGDDDADDAERAGRIRQERTAPPKVKEQEDEEVVENYVTVKYNGTIVDVLWSPGDDVSVLKERIEVALGLESSQFKIKLKGVTLEDEESIDELDLEEDSELEVVAGLFAQMAGMSRVAFAVDLSGSMSAGVGKGHTQMSVVQDHLRRCIRSLKGEGCEIGIATFTSSANLPLGPAMVKSCQMNDAIKAVDNMKASGGNGGEANCLRALINMDPQCIFFLGDGGWSGQDLIKEANVAVACGIQIHSIAFYLQGVGSGLPEIAKMTGGTYRDVKSIAEYSMV